jgi:hypothetical protein
MNNQELKDLILSAGYVSIAAFEAVSSYCVSYKTGKNGTEYGLKSATTFLKTKEKVMKALKAR